MLQLKPTHELILPNDYPVKPASFFQDYQPVKTPEPEANGKIKTKNKMGFMMPDITVIAAEFVKFASLHKAPVLDAGAAYGVATIPALKAGATVIANDIEIEHLTALAQDVRLSDEERKRLYINNESLLDDIDFPEDSLGAILLSNVTHFFNRKQTLNLLKKARKWLKDDGKLFIVAASPYHGNLKDFSREYHQKILNGHTWPGEILDLDTKYIPEDAGKIPSFLHATDPVIMSKILEKSGFMIKRLELFGDERCPKDNGAGFIGVIAEKRMLVT